MLSANEIKKIVIECLEEITMAEYPELEEIEKITSETDPFEDLCLTSRAGVEFTIEIGEQINFDIPHEINLFVRGKKGNPIKRNVGEIVGFIEKLLKEAEKEND